MRLKLIFSLAILCWSGVARTVAQAITISEELPVRAEYAYTIMGWVSKDFLLFRDKGHEFYIQAFDEDMHVRWEREIYLGDRKADIIGVFAHPDRFHLIYGMREKGDYHIYHRSYAHDVTLIDSVLIDTLPNVFITPQIQMHLSEDKYKLVLYREDGNTLLLTGYDLKRESKLWQRSLKLGGSNLQRDYSVMEISNQGDFYLVLEPDKFLQKTQNLELFSAANGQEEIRQVTVKLENLTVYDYYAVYDNVHARLVLTGLYSERNTGRAQGFYFLRYQPGDSATVHLLPFDESLIAEVEGKDVAASKGLSDFNVQDVALQQDGGALIIAELNKEFSRRSSIPLRRDNGAFTRGGWIDYYYEDLILFAVHPDGTEHWKEVLRKRQYSQDDDAMYSSYFLFKTPARLRFLFNDEIKQENTVGGYEVTGTGHVERKTVFNTDYQRLKLRFKDGIQSAYNECIVPSERNNRLSLVRIVYED